MPEGVFMKTILCYGDSNTWGANPSGGERFDQNTRWPGVLRNILNEGCGPANPAYWVVEEGLSGRTSCREDFVEGDRNGLRQLIPILGSHKPLDLVVIMLGTNDLKPRFSPTEYDVARGSYHVAKAARDSLMGPDDTAPRVLMICPPATLDSPATRHLFKGSEEISPLLPTRYRQFAEELGILFLDANTIISSSKSDGIHLDPESHKKLGEAVAKIVRENL